ncbi:MAG: ribosomal protein methyltransferase [Fibrobacteres bacterium]|nr:ribosomal protein methyltransferase [Fibrobacterota bacterium]
MRAEITARSCYFARDAITLKPDAELQSTFSLPSESLLARFAPIAPVPGLPHLRAHQARDVFELWQAWEDETGEKQDVPFWATVWPAALMTAKFISGNPGLFAGKNVLDFGCGSGIAGVAAMKAGAARVTANDIDPAALALSGRNALLNGVSLSIEERNLLDTPPDPDWNVVLVADMFYEKSVSEAMLAWLGRARSNGAAVFIADASRPFGPRTGVKVLLEETYPTDIDLEGASRRTVRLLAYLP